MLKKVIANSFIGIIIISTSIMLSFCCSDWIRSLISSFLVVEEEVIIKISEDMPEGKGVCILYEGSADEYFEDLRIAAENDSEWKYTKGEAGVSWTRLESDIKGAEIRFSAKANPINYIAFLQVGWGGSIEIQADGEKATYDLCKLDGSDIIHVYPFKNMNYDAGFRVFFHVIISIIIMLVLTYFFILLKGKIKTLGLTL